MVSHHVEHRAEDKVGIPPIHKMVFKCFYGNFCSLSLYFCPHLINAHLSFLFCVQSSCYSSLSVSNLIWFICCRVPQKPQCRREWPKSGCLWVGPD